MLCMCVCVCVLQWGHSRGGCDLASTLCKYDLKMCFIGSELGNGATSGLGSIS